MKKDTGEPEVTEMKLRELIDQIADPSPAPGGGAVASVAGALGGGLIHMATGISCTESLGELEQSAIENVRNGAHRLLELAERDQRAFESYSELRQSETGSEESVHEALRESTKVPLDIGGCCLDLLEYVLAVREELNTSLETDVTLAIELLRTASATVRDLASYNIGQLPDDPKTSALRNRLDNQQKRMNDLRTRLNNNCYE